jgi:hypothetical protein
MRKASIAAIHSELFYKAAVSSSSGPKGSGLPAEFWIQFVQMCQRLNANPYNIAAVINNESGFDPAARNIQGGKIIAQGFNQLIKKTAQMLGITDHLWENFYLLPPTESLKWTEKFFQRFPVQNKTAGDIYLMNFGGYKNPDGSIYASLAFQEAYKKQHPEAVFKNPQYQDLAVKQNSGLAEGGRIMPDKVRSMVANGPPSGIKSKIDEAIQSIQGQATPPFSEPNPNWQPSDAPQDSVVTPAAPSLSNEFVPVKDHQSVSELARTKQREWIGQKPVGYTEIVNWNGKEYQLRVAPHDLKGATGERIDPVVFQEAKNKGFPLSEAGKTWLYAVEVYERKQSPGAALTATTAPTVIMPEPATEGVSSALRALNRKLPYTWTSL